jgi:hypothetical protein
MNLDQNFAFLQIRRLRDVYQPEFVQTVLIGNPLLHFLLIFFLRMWQMMKEESILMNTGQM